MNGTRATAALVLGFFLIVLFSAQIADASNLPRSRQATLLESVSPSEVMIQATGIAVWKKGDSKKKDMNHFLTQQAERDARKAAVWFVLYGGTDPLLTEQSEKANFATIEEGFFSDDNIARFISWESEVTYNAKKTTIKEKKEYKFELEKRFKVNRQMIREYLVNKGVIAAKASLMDILGLPNIMVLPATPKGQNPLQLLTKPNIAFAARTIESYLTARRYDVIVPEAQQNISELALAQLSLKGEEEDYSYQLALSMGSDIYITYEVNVEPQKLGTRKAIASVRAYETTTARLLGAETGYSPTTDSADEVLIEAAIQDAIDNVLSRITAYWKQDLERGIQYKLIVSISGDFDEQERSEIGDVLFDIIDNISNNGNFKENAATDRTLDYLIWAKPHEYRQSRKLARAIEKEFANEFSDGTLKRVTLNRKLLVYTVAPE